MLAGSETGCQHQRVEREVCTSVRGSKRKSTGQGKEGMGEGIDLVAWNLRLEQDSWSRCREETGRESPHT